MAVDGMQITYAEVGTTIDDIGKLRTTIESIFDDFGKSVGRVNQAGLRGKGGEGFENAYHELKATFPSFDQALEALANNYQHSKDENENLDSNITKLAESINDQMANIH